MLATLVNRVKREPADDPPHHRRVSKRPKSVKLTPALYKATIKELAATTASIASASGVELSDEVLGRIQKCLRLAQHTNTGEAEAKAALFMATKLMNAHNVDRAEFMARQTEEEGEPPHGASVVQIKRANGEHKPVNRQQHVNDVACAIKLFFDCRCMSGSTGWIREWTFFGIPENTIAAATAFEMVYNQIAEWARPYKGVAGKNSYSTGVATQLVRLAKATKKKEEEQAQEAGRLAALEQQRVEEEQRAAEIRRLEPNPYAATLTDEAELDTDEIETISSCAFDAVANPSSNRKAASENGMTSFADFPAEISSDMSTESDSVDDDYDSDSDWALAADFNEKDDLAIDLSGDIDQEIQKLIKQEPIEISDDDSVLGPDLDDHSFASARFHGEDVKPNDTTDDVVNDAELPVSTWKSSMQLVLFRKDADARAEDYLKSKGIKLRKGRKQKFSIKDRGAYEQGKEDGKKIDVYRKRIEDRAEDAEDE